MNTDIFTQNSAQDVPLDSQDIVEIELREVRKLVKAILKEEILFDELQSPLTYQRSSNIKRLSLIDTESPEFKKHDTHFAVLKRFTYTGDTGRRLKNPREVVTPGSAPGTIAFLDYHIPSENFIYIDYMKTRNDMRGQGHATKLIDELVNIHGKDAYYDFGRIINSSAGALQKRLEAKGIKTRGYHDY